MIRLNPLRTDPTRTVAERRRLEQMIMARLAVLKREIIQLVDTEDVFGLREPDTPPTFNEKRASTQLNVLDEAVVAQIKRIQAELEPADIIELEDEPHITVRYGLDEVGPERVEHIAHQHRPIEVVLGGLSLFESAEQDVLKIDVQSPELERLHYHLRLIPGKDAFRDYRPHLTIAYLQPRTGHKYVGLSGLEGKRLVFQSMVYSSAEREQTELVFNANCGTGAGGFKPGNTCAKGGFGALANTEVENWDDAIRWQYTADYEIQEGIRKYQGGAAETLHDSLRKGIKPSGNSLHADEALEQLQQEGEFKAKGTFIRGVALDIGLKEGDIYQPKEWQSATTSLEVAIRFAVTGGSGGLVDISPVLYRFRSDEGLLIGGPESEVVLKKNAKYKVVATSTQKVRANNYSDEQLKIKVVDMVQEGTITTNAAIWKWLSSDEKLAEFMAWVLMKMKAVVTGDQKQMDHWLTKYIEKVFTKGMSRAYDQVKKPGMEAKLDFYNGKKSEFLSAAFFKPVSAARVKLLASRAFNELEGMTDEMATRMQRTLVDGFIRGDSPRTIARSLANEVDEIGRKRARVIARTEVVRAHNEGQLNAMEALGVTDVGVQVEWTTSGLGTTAAGNPSPCKLCAPLAGVVFDIKDAHGLIPRHPNCLCSWIPAGVGEDPKGQIKSKKAVYGRVSRSIKREGKKSRWIGRKLVKNERVRPRYGRILWRKPNGRWMVCNDNCGTGAGGFKPGNTCAKGGKGGSGGVGAVGEVVSGGKFFGYYSPSAMLKWMGSQGWKPKDARKVLEGQGFKLANSTIYALLSDGKKGIGKKPELSDEAAAAMEALRKAPKKADAAALKAVGGSESLQKPEQKLNKPVELPPSVKQDLQQKLAPKAPPPQAPPTPPVPPPKPVVPPAQTPPVTTPQVQPSPAGIGAFKSPIGFDDHSASAVVRWMGKEGWSTDEAMEVLKARGVIMQRSSVAAILRHGKKGIRGKPADLNAEQADLLNSMRGKKAQAPVPKSSLVIPKPSGDLRSAEYGIGEGTAARVAAAKVNGRSIAADLADIEDNDVLAWAEVDADGKPVTKLHMKLTVEGSKKLSKAMGIDEAASQSPYEQEYKTILFAAKQVNYSADHGWEIQPSTYAMVKLDEAKRNLTELADKGDPAAKYYLDLANQVSDAKKNKTKAPFVTQYQQIGKGTMAQAAAQKIKAQYALADLRDGNARRTDGIGTLPGEAFVMETEGVKISFIPSGSGKHNTALRGTLEMTIGEAVSNESIQKGMQRLEKLGIKTAPPDPKWEESLYIHRSVYLRNDHNKPSYRAIWDDKKLTNEERVAKQKAWVKENYNIELPDQPTEWYNPRGVTMNSDGSGRRTWYRWDLPPEKVRKEMSNYHLTHRSSVPMDELVDALLNSGGELTPTVGRIRKGVSLKVGMSPNADLESGGASYFFTRVKAKKVPSEPLLTFKIDRLARQDVVAYQSDEFGSVNKFMIRKSSLAEFKDMAKGSTNEACFKNGLSLLDDIEYIYTKDKLQADKVLDVFKKHGLTQLPDGRLVTDVVRIAKAKW